MLVLRAHGKESIKSELREQLDQAANAAKAVFKQFKGLLGVVPKEFEYKTARDDANAKVGKSRTCNAKPAA